MKRSCLVIAVLGLWLGQTVAQDDLVIRLQTALQRSGCLAGEPDGIWGAASKAALARFLRAIRENADNLEPTPGYLALAEAVFDPICTSSGSADEPPVAAPSAPPPGGAYGTCVLATISVGNKPNLGAWDFGSGPDTVLTETSTGSSGLCKDSHSCTIRITNPPDTLSFVAIDQDGVGDNDPIGQGSCRGQMQCSLPPAATVSLTAC